MAEQLQLGTLEEAVKGRAAAFRARTRLQPAGGPGDKIFPPTFAGAVYTIEYRRLPDRAEPVSCVILDTVQSQANRMEEALLSAARSGRLRLPLVEVDFSDADLLDPVGRITTLEAPHRIADAIFRDSQVDGTGFRQSEIGGTLDQASSMNATPLYRLCPTALVLGLWDSTGPKGGLGVKFERAIASEIVGVGLPPEERVTEHRIRGLRRDPLGIREGVRIAGGRDGWKVAEDPKAKGVLRPSEINHSNVPFEGDNAGVTVEYAEQAVTLSLIVLRRLSFPLEDIQSDEDVDVRARVVLAALGLAGATLASEYGLDLRSRCVLWPEEPIQWELLERPGQEPRRFGLTGEQAIDLLEQAVEAAEGAGLEWLAEPLVLTPSEQLVELVRQSQAATAAAGAEEA